MSDLNERWRATNIDKELVLLRARVGMTVNKIDSLCPNLKALPVVARELERYGDDVRLSAGLAYEAVVCVVKSFSGDYLDLLTTTLCIGLDEADRYFIDHLGRRRLAQLTQREESVQARRTWTPDEYATQRDDAYAQLRTRLVGLQHWPCPRHGDSDAGAVDHEAQLLKMLVEHLKSAYSLARALEHADAERILEFLPNGARAAEPALRARMARFGIWGSPREVQLNLLLGSIIRRMWPPKEPPMVGEWLSAAAFESLRRSGLHLAGTRAITGERNPDLLGLAVLGELDAAEAERRVNMHLVELGRLLLEVERADIWDSVLGEATRSGD